ncbi:MAG TPA: MATE family efflux transporter [Actinocrinis sp.]|nr:MATE family efflux transporter [Actinocrinis sp.]
MNQGSLIRERPDALGTEPVGRLLRRACTQTTMSVGVYGIYALTNAWFVFLNSIGAGVLAAVANRLLIAAAGPLALAAYALCTRIGTFATMPQTGIAQGLQVVAGYNAGLGATGRVDRAISLALRTTLLYGAAICLLLLAVAHPLVDAFTTDPALRAHAVTALHLLAPTYLLVGVGPLVASSFQAQGRPGPAYVISAGGIACVRIPVLLVSSRFGAAGVPAGFPVAEAIVAALVLLVRHRRASVGGPVGLPCRAPPAPPRGGQEEEP